MYFSNCYYNHLFVLWIIFNFIWTSGIIQYIDESSIILFRQVFIIIRHVVQIENFTTWSSFIGFVERIVDSPDFKYWTFNFHSQRQQGAADELAAGIIVGTFFAECRVNYSSSKSLQLSSILSRYYRYYVVPSSIIWKMLEKFRKNFFFSKFENETQIDDNCKSCWLCGCF